MVEDVHITIDAPSVEELRQLPYMKEELDPWQVIAVWFIKKYKKVLFADKMGIGKTFPTLCATLTEEENFSILITCGNSALVVWPKEIEKWYPEHLDRLVLVEGTKAYRSRIWNNAKQGKIYLTSLGSFRSDIEIIPWNWDCVIIDEAHKAKNWKAQLFDTLCKLQVDNMLVMISGSPTSKGLHELFAYLKLAFRKKWTSYWNFVYKYFYVDAGMWGKAVCGIKDAQGLVDILSPFLLRRMEVDDKEPVKYIPLYVKPTAIQDKIYLALAEDMLAETSPDEWLAISTTMGKSIKLRQLLNCPKILDPAIDDYGSAIEAICQHFEDSSETHTVIFSPFPSGFPYLSEYIQKRLKVIPYILRGGMKSTEVEAIIESWKEEGGPLLLSIPFAQSFDLTKAAFGYFLGFEWDPNLNDQAVFRIHRRSSPRAGTIFYVTHGDLYVDADVREVLDTKGRENKLINNIIPNLQKLLHKNKGDQ